MPLGAFLLGARKLTEERERLVDEGRRSEEKAKETANGDRADVDTDMDNDVDEEDDEVETEIDEVAEDGRDGDSEDDDAEDDYAQEDADMAG